MYNYKVMTNQELAVCAIEGDQDALSLLVNKFEPLIASTVSQFYDEFGNKIARDDILQQTRYLFIASIIGDLQEGLAPYKPMPPVAFEYYIKFILKTRMRNYCKKQVTMDKRSKESFDEQIYKSFEIIADTSLVHCDDVLVLKEAANDLNRILKRVYRMINRFSVVERLILYLMMFQRKSQQEIAQILVEEGVVEHMTQQNVSRILNDMLNKIRNNLLTRSPLKSAK